ncbi:MAG TPA: ABC transporter ATP-binding protein [Kofleriaceae bacterium]|nr:ABC transporter ATP-binding protein [Kofleriaceae bacterium]
MSGRDGGAMLRVRELGKRLGGRRVLDGVDLEVDGGAAVVVRGANGAGKSTLLRIVAGVIEPDAGLVEIAGVSITGDRVAARRALGYVPEGADPPEHLTVDEVIRLAAALKRVDLPGAELRARLGVDTLGHKRIERLSLGERRRACLAAALVGTPRLLVMDEPSNGLDVAGVAELVALLREQMSAGAAVLIASHDGALAEAIGARVALLEGGKLADHSAEAARG